MVGSESPEGAVDWVAGPHTQTITEHHSELLPKPQSGVLSPRIVILQDDGGEYVAIDSGGRTVADSSGIMYTTFLPKLQTHPGPPVCKAEYEPKVVALV